MASIFKPITITWGGEEHTIKPTYAMIQKIEGQGVSIAGIVNRSQKGETPFSQVALVLSVLLQSAGVKVTAEQVYLELFRGSQAQLSEIVLIVSTAFFPEAEEGNEKAPKGAK